MKGSLLYAAAAALLCLAGETHAATTSVATCQARCSVRASVCSKRQTAARDKCTAPYNCGTAACKSDYACSYGCSVCASYWNYYINDCDQKLTVCNARCVAP